MVSPQGGHASLIDSTFGGYEVEALIGRGATGTVYLARDPRLRRRVALKVLLGSVARSPSLVDQFRLEAQATAPLNHPGIVRLYEAGVESGTPFIAMEFVDGEPLDRFLRRKTRIRWQQALHIGRKIADALDYAHRLGIVHRDVKPSNIILDGEGAIRLMDFGIASVQNEGGPNRSRFVGTPQYMSPEQCTARPTGPSSDLFSLGVMLYEMISGEKPFYGESPMALFKSICTEDPPRLNALDEGVPDDVSRLVAYLMSKRPDGRPENGETVCRIIDRLQSEQGGVSAVPAALTAFLQEETEPRPFSSLKADSRRRVRGGGPSGRMAWARDLPWRGAVRRGIVVILVCCALLAAPLRSMTAREGETDLAPIINAASFKDESSSAMSAHLFAEGFRFTRVSWVGDMPVAIVEAQGIDGKLTTGATGLLSVDPVNKRFRSLRVPTGPVTGGGYSQLQPAELRYVSVPETSPASLLHDSFLVTMNEYAGGPLVTLAQKYDEASPRPAVLVRISREQLYGGIPVPWSRQTSARAVIKPDGHTVCMILYDTRTRMGYLSERDLRPEAPDSAEIILTYKENDIIPQSIQYTSTGESIVYLIRGYRGTRQLWLVPSGGKPDQARMVVDRVVADEFALSPDGRRAALTRRGGDGRLSRAEVALVDLDDGTVQTRLGPGKISPWAWHPSGRHLVVLREARAPGARAKGDPNGKSGGVSQLWAIETMPPYRGVQLTKEESGISPAYAVSRDGNWIVSVTNEEIYPSLLFLKWDELTMSRSV